MSNDVFMGNFHRLPAVFTKGEGSWLFDINGKKYLDFSSGISKLPWTQLSAACKSNHRTGG